MGKQGANVNELREALGVSFYVRSGQSTDQVVCYAPDKAKFGAVEKALRVYQIAPTHSFEIQMKDLGRFFGAKGAKVQQLQKSTHTLISKCKESKNILVVRPRDDLALESLAVKLKVVQCDIDPVQRRFQSGATGTAGSFCLVLRHGVLMHGHEGVGMTVRWGWPYTQGSVTFLCPAPLDRLYLLRL